MGAQAVGFIAFVKILVSYFMVGDFIAEEEGGRFEQAMGDHHRRPFRAFATGAAPKLRAQIPSSRESLPHLQ
jgi:hypothetical protein